MGKKESTSKKAPVKSQLAKKAPKSLDAPIPQDMSKQQKKIFLQQRIFNFQQFDYDQIIDRFSPVLEMIKNGGTMRQAAYAGGVSVDELRVLLNFGRFGGSDAWTAFYEEFFRQKSAAELIVMQNLQACAEAGEKWAIQRLMNIMAPEEFGAFDVLPESQANPAPGIVQNFYTPKEYFSESDILDAESEDIEDSTN
jgi:hypothetical protein